MKRRSTSRPIPSNGLAILRKEQVVELSGLSYSSIRREVERGAFPKPVQIGLRAIGWRNQDILDWLQNRKAGFLPRTDPFPDGH